MILGVLLCAGFAAHPAAGGDTPPTAAVGAAVMPASTAPAPDPRPLTVTEAAVVVTLPALTPEESARLTEQAAAPGPLRLGFGRPIPGQATAAFAPEAAWRERADGSWVAAVRLTSPGALGLRLAVQVTALPDTATLHLLAPDAGPVADAAGSAIHASVRSNRAGGATGEAAETYWLPLVAGDSLTLAITRPAGVGPQAVRVTLARLSHFVQWPFADTEAGAAGVSPCREAVGCHPKWDAASRATALLIHTDEAGASGACTGVLLNDADPATRIPYLLTAHHCVADQTRASSLEAYFFHRARSCGGPLEPPQAVSGGADLLDAAAPTDTSFLRLRAPPPAGAVFLGWSAVLPPIGTAVAGIHHPRGAPQQIAFGTVTGRRHCAEVGACAGGTATGGEHLLEVTWSPGDTAAGSSGSALLLADTQELVGTLFGGVSGCERAERFADYGRFDLAYRAALYRWLGPDPPGQGPR